ncbi:hypothetical protein ACHAXR_005752 [Thalassiosira sp. AJA248-18]
MSDPPMWAGAHATTEISTNPQDYVFFLSKDQCFSNAYREKNGHHPAVAGTIPPAAIAADAPKFWCINQELHYQKAVLFNDHATGQAILAEQNDATKIKQLGRLVQGYDDAKWCQVRDEICRNALYAKFSQDEELKQILLATGTKIIVEAATDKVWGLGCVEYSSPEDGIVGAKNNKDAGIWDIEPKDWVGGNLLGRCLMDVRKILSESG